MANYRFPQFNLDIIDPTVTIDGEVGTTINDNIPSNTAYADIILTTDTAKFGVRLEGSPEPASWTMEDLSVWVGLQL